MLRSTIREKNWKNLIFGCSIGNVLELYDFIIYSNLAVILSQLFFPAENKFVSILLTFAVFMMGCIVRPIGSLFFGHLGDMYGRKRALVWSISLATIFTVLIGLLPTHQQIGNMAPLLLLICRIIQSLSLCGEEVGAILFLSESSPQHQKCFAVSIIMGNIYLGLLMGSLVTFILSSVLSNEALIQWGWRIPFLLASVFGIIAIWIRLKQGDSVSFESLFAKERSKKPVLEVLTLSPKTLIYGTLLISLYALAIYLFATYIPNYLKMYGNLSLTATMLISSSGFLIASLLTPLVGFLTNRIKAEIFLVVGLVGMIILAYPIFYLLATHTLFNIIIAQLLLVILLSLITGTSIYYLAKIFPTRIRFSGVGICFNLSMTLFGSSAPIIFLWMSHLAHSIVIATFYFMMMGLLSIIALYRLIIINNRVRN